MKNSKIKRSIAFLLCMVILSCSGSSAFASMAESAGDIENVEAPEEKADDLNSMEAPEEPEGDLSAEPMPEGESAVIQEPAPEEEEMPDQIFDTADPGSEEIEAVPETEETADNAEVNQNPDDTEQEITENRPGEELPLEKDEDKNAENPETGNEDSDINENPEEEQDLTESPAEEEPEAFEDRYEDEQVVIWVEADPGVVPDGAQLSVKQVVQQDVEALKADHEADAEMIAEAEELNAKYEDVQRELEVSVAEGEEKELGGFLAYDISFLVTDEEGETKEIEPDGNVSVTMEFAEAYLPEELTNREELQVASVDVVHMKEVEDEETGETVLKAEVLEDAEIDRVESDKVEKAGFVVDSFSTFTISWTTIKGANRKNFTIEIFCVDEKGNEFSEVNMSDLTLDVKEGEIIDLSDYAPKIEGYALCNIKRNHTNGWQIRDLRGGYNSNECTIQVIRGAWTSGKWENGEWKEATWTANADATWGKWNDEPKKIYFVYEPTQFCVSAVYVDQDGKEIPGMNFEPLVLYVRDGKRVDLAEYFSNVKGYTLRCIRLNDNIGYQVSYLESDTEGNLVTERGDWSNGVWTSRNEEQITWTRPERKIYIQYDSIVEHENISIEAYYVDKYGQEIQDAGPETITLENMGLETVKDLSAYAPEIPGYALYKIRINDEKKGAEIRHLKGGRSNSNSNLLCLRRQKGTWSGGIRSENKWVNSQWEVNADDQRWFEWTDEPKKIYFIYEPTEFTLPIYCVDQNGDPMPEISVDDLKLPAKEAATIDLMDYIPEIPGFTLQRIRRNNMSGYQVRYLRTDAEGDLWREQGTWNNGVWSPSEEGEIKWTSKPEGLYFIYQPATISVTYIDQETGQEISGVTAAPLTLTGLNDSPLDILTYVPYINGYELHSVRADGQSGPELRELRNGIDTDGTYKIFYTPGTWSMDQGKLMFEETGDSEPWTAENKMLYVLYAPLSPAGSTDPGDGTEDAPAPAHRKYIRYNEEDKDYTLTLDVMGRQEAAKPIDILLIVDLSNSMEEENGQKTNRFENLNNALEELKSALQEAADRDKNLKINIGVVSFNSSGMPDKVDGERRSDWTCDMKDDKADADSRGWYSLDSFNWKVTAAMCKGATNWQAGIRLGESELSAEEREDHRKYVIFLTDGNPTCRYFTGSETITQGNGADDPYGNNYHAAINEWSQSSALCSSAARFVIDANETPENDCERFAKAIKAEELSGVDNQSMSESFRKIAGEIIYPGYTDVAITDTLSVYTEFAEEQPEITVTYQEKDWDEEKELVDENGAKLYTAQTEGKKVTVSLLNGGKLVDGTIYRISFKVKPTQEARDEYARSGYPHRGDPDTDAEGNETSSNKPGFHSNADNGAVVNYRYNYGPKKEAPYLHPVVQVEKPDAEHAEITKTMGKAVEDEDGRIQYPITLQVKTRQEIINQIAVGSTGNGWTVIDKMADYTEFLALDGTAMNGYKVTLSEDKMKLLLLPMNAPDLTEVFTVAEYTPGESGKGTLTWHLSDLLAVADYDMENAVTNYTYTLTYYVRFADSKRTELRNTNETTYVVIPDRTEKLYPDRMPFFVNIIGSKKDADETGTLLPGAEFAVYRDMNKEQLLAEGIVADEDGHFAFQIGQSDLTDGQMTVYLEESKAPEGYVKDEVLHPIVIQVSDVSYKNRGGAEGSQIWDSKEDADWGTASGNAALSHEKHDAADEDLLSVSSSEELKILYSNHAKTSWSIVKISSSDPQKRLNGAEFKLYAVRDGAADKTPSYTGVTDSQGKISSWKQPGSDDAISPAFIQAGEYELHETKAPEGYALSEEIWRITISEDGTVVVTSNGTEVIPEDKDGIFCYCFKNSLLYELPSAGGAGIYWYTISGTLLMIAGLLILYKRKYAGRC